MVPKRERYTPNDVGPSPLEWKTPQLSEISTLITNGFVGTATPFYTNITGVPYLYGTNVRANKLETNGIRYVTHEFHAAQSKTALKAGDLLTVQSGHIGETAVVTDQFEGANCHALIVTRLKQDKADPIYLCFYVNSEIGRARMKGLEVGSTILHINTKDFKKFRVLLPSLPEQKKIAQILSAWDSTISLTEKLLTNSQQQKKALMQQLLTGKKRLQDENGVRFSGEWEKVKLGDVFEKVCNGLTYDASSLEGLPVTRIETISTGSVNFEKVGWAPDCDSTRRFKLEFGDILYSHINSLEHIGRVAYYNDEKPLYHGMNLLLLRTKSQSNSLFLFYLLNSQIGKKYAKTYAKSAVNQASISTTDIKTFQVFIPEREEQKKIASVLSAADAEISTLEKKIACLKDEKKALMQQLLTGKRRVVVEMDAA